MIGFVSITRCCHIPPPGRVPTCVSVFLQFSVSSHFFNIFQTFSFSIFHAINKFYVQLKTQARIHIPSAASPRVDPQATSGRTGVGEVVPCVERSSGSRWFCLEIPRCLATSYCRTPPLAGTHCGQHCHCFSMAVVVLCGCLRTFFQSRRFSSASFGQSLISFGTGPTPSWEVFGSA